MNVVDQIIFVKLKGGSFYFDFELRKWIKVNNKSEMIPINSIEYYYTDICECGGLNPTCDGKMKTEFILKQN